MRLRVIPYTACAALFVLCLTASGATAAEFTDLADAADDKDDLIDDTYDPFDLVIDPTLQIDLGSAKITREAACVPDDSDLVGQASKQYEQTPRLDVDPNRCDRPTTVFNREMEYEETSTTLDLALKAGLYKDLEFHLHVPFVINQTRGLSYAEDVDPTNSSVDPSDDRIRSNAERVFAGSQNPAEQLEFFSTDRYFDLSNEPNEIERSGFADPSVGLHWAPFNDERDDTKATLLLGMDYIMPIAPIARRGNDDVGKGKHVLSWKLASSKKFDWVEPYFGLNYKLPLPASDSLFERIDINNDGQVFKNPPQKGEITVGTEFIPYEDPAKGTRYSIDLRFRFAYTSDGRDYTPLFDHLTSSECNGKTLQDVLPEVDQNGDVTDLGDVQCAWIARKPANAKPDPIYDLTSVDPATDNSEFNTDGIMTVESFGTYAGRAGFNLQPSKYFQFRGAVSLTHHQEHFITNARTGKDGPDENDTVDLEGEEARIEKNPVFNATYDSNGNRFRVQEWNVWSFFITTAVKF